MLEPVVLAARDRDDAELKLAVFGVISVTITSPNGGGAINGAGVRGVLRDDPLPRTDVVGPNGGVVGIVNGVNGGNDGDNDDDGGDCDDSNGGLARIDTLMLRDNELGDGDGGLLLLAMVTSSTEGVSG
jgi:hypothetical protein